LKLLPWTLVAALWVVVISTVITYDNPWYIGLILIVIASWSTITAVYVERRVR